jgi:uncharacterized membrane protein YdjX (TVP38/TMEM64 family)
MANQAAPTPMSNRTQTRILRALAVLLVIGISIAIFFLSDRIRQLQSLGYGGAFFIMLFGNATVILPAPGLTIVFSLGAAFNPLLIGVSAGAGAGLGELTGYLAGYSGRAVIEGNDLYERFERWMYRYGFLAIFVLAVIPNPFFDIAGIVAGALRFTWWRFLLVAWAGKTVQGIAVAYAGALSANWILKWLTL